MQKTFSFGAAFVAFGETLAAFVAFGPRLRCPGVMGSPPPPGGQEDPVLEAAKLNITEPTASESSTKETNIEQTGGMEVEHECAEHDTPSLLVAPKQVVEHEDNETWLTIPQNKSPLARKTNGKATQRPEVEPPTGSPSRYHLLSNELEEGEVDVEEDSSDEESSVESQTALEKKKQMERQKSGKKKKSQK
ncbi:hypothetical protein IGI04_001627, partial [Brassica rapa subsp. trilocularis]